LYCDDKKEIQCEEHKGFFIGKTVPKSSKSEVAMLPYKDNTFLKVAKKKKKKRGFKKKLLFSCG
jgi:hypothetical protein